MDVLGAANETHARHAEAVSIEGLLGRGDERWVIGQAEVIVRAEIENALAPRDGNVCVLRRGNNPLSFVKTLRFDFIKRLRELLIKFGEHAAILREPGRVQSQSYQRLCAEISVAHLVNNVLITPRLALEILSVCHRYRTRGNQRDPAFFLWHDR